MKNLRVLVFLSVVLNILLLGISLPTYASVTITPSTVLKNEALIAAQDYIDTIGPTFSTDWENSLAEDPVLYNDYNGIPTAYVVSVVKDSQEIGYVVVSASMNLYPVLEAGKSLPPHRQLDQALQEAKKILQLGEVIGEPKLIYSGMLWFTAEIPILKDGKQVDNLSYHLKAKKLLFKGNPTPTIPKLDQQKEKESKLIWDKIKKKSSYGSSEYISSNILSSEVSILSSKSISGVPIYDQSDSSHPSSGCGPASGAMILGYWDTHGYTNLQNDSDRIYGIQLQNELYSDMGTSAIGTSLVGWTSGIRTHANTHSGYNFTSGYSDKSAPYSTSWSVVTSEVNNYRPFGFYVGWDNGNAGDLYYDYHFVTGKGYSDNGVGNRYITINNSWGSTDSINFDNYWNGKDNIAVLWVHPS